MPLLLRSLLFALLAVRAATSCAGSVPIDEIGCTTEALFAQGFEDDAPCYVPDSSKGTGGDATSGDHTGTVYVASLGVTREYAWRIPSGFDPEKPAALLVALHGSSGNVKLAATTLRNNWGLVVESEGVIVLTPHGTGSGGGWRGNDADTIAAAVAQLEAQYPIDRRRRYLWGYSAGAHFGHSVVLDDPTPWAAYGVSAGALTQYACGVPGAPSCNAWLATASSTNRLPVSITIGTQDPLYPYASGDPARFESAGWAAPELRYVEFAGGHAYHLPHLVDTWAYLGRYAQAR
ncbi:MAG TPA: hypothetical protein VND91_10275 [Candidatus Saccharimonadia bacterium]|nr:hypothetical protein [Candidatus Saccharimonadia bacterium]